MFDCYQGGHFATKFDADLSCLAWFKIVLYSTKYIYLCLTTNVMLGKFQCFKPPHSRKFGLHCGTEIARKAHTKLFTFSPFFS